MRSILSLVLLLTAAPGQITSQRLPADDAVRIREFYRLATAVQDQVWPQWSSIPAPLLLVTSETEFLTHHPSPPKDFQPTEDGLLFRPRQFSTDLLATFPAFGPPSVIVIGQPHHTASKSSTPWLITLMHEHFHQLQNAQPGYFQAVQDLNLSHGYSSGMWMLNYPFPYENREIAQSFAHLRDRLLSTLNEKEGNGFETAAKAYVQDRKKFFAQLSADDSKYLEFQLWQEGIARYTQIKVAEATANYQPTAEYKALADFEPFSVPATQQRTDTLNELKQADLGKWKRTVVYSFGAAEGLLLDRLNPQWKEQYFSRPFSLAALFTN